MYKEDLIKVINEKINDISSPYKLGDSELYLEEFLENNSYIGTENFINMDIKKGITCLYYVLFEKNSIEECIETIDSFYSMTERLKTEDLELISNVFYSLIEKYGLSNIIEIFKEKNKFKTIKSFLKNFSKASKEDIRDIYLLKTDLEKGNCDLEIFFQMLKEDVDNTFKILAIILVYRLMKEEYKLIIEALDDYEGNIRNKDREKFINENLRRFFNFKALAVEFDKIKKEYEDNNYLVNRKEKKRKKCIFDYERAIKLIEKAFSSEEITNAREIVKYIEDDDIENQVLKAIIAHNAKYYSKLEEEYNLLSKNTVKNYQVLLNDLNINYDEFDIEKIMHNTLDDIKEMVNVLNKLEISDNDKLNVLANSDLETLLKVSDFIFKGFIPKQEVISDISILFTNDSKFNSYLENIKFLDNYNINPYLFKNSLSIMFNGSDLLKNGLEVLNSYGLIDSIKTTSDFSFFYEDYISRIDKMIELGYYSFLKDNLGLLNYTNINRLEMLKTLGEEVNSMDQMIFILESESFFVPDSLIDSYLPDEVSLHDEIFISKDNLAEFGVDNLTYNISGILVSSNKVSRELEKGNSVYKAITKGLMLGEEDYNLLVDAFWNKKKLK